MHQYSRLAVAALSAFVVSCGGNNENDMAANDTATSMSGGTVAEGATTGNGPMSDAQIHSTLIASNAAEVAAGKLAKDSATNAEVKTFANMMVTDHEAMNKEVHALGQKLNLVSGSGGHTDHVAESSNETAQKLAGKKGADFDRAYMDAMVEDHEKTLRLLDDAANASNTPDVDALIAKARPKVQEHLEKARQIRSKLN
jgi:putative membrane protein